MAKASWANQSFKKSDRKKYADGGEVKMDLGGSSYADNSGGTWGEMGSRALDERRDNAATDEINKVTSETTKAHDDNEDLTSSFKDKAEDSGKTERENAPWNYTPEPAKAASAPASKPAAKASSSNEDQVSRTASREAAKKESFSDQVSRKMDRAKRAFTGNLTDSEKSEARAGVRAAARNMASGSDSGEGYVHHNPRVKYAAKSAPSHNPRVKYGKKD